MGLSKALCKLDRLCSGLHPALRTGTQQGLVTTVAEFQLVPSHSTRVDPQNCLEVAPRVDPESLVGGRQSSIFRRKTTRGGKYYLKHSNIPIWEFFIPLPPTLSNKRGSRGSPWKFFEIFQVEKIQIQIQSFLST